MKGDRIQLVDSVAACWTALGVLFNVRPASGRVDLERLLLDTARAAPANTRLLIMAVTWLARHGNTVAKHRLANLVRHELQPEHQLTLGLLLDLAREARFDGARLNRTRFNLAIAVCAESINIGEARPLSEVEARSIVRSKIAEQRASTVSQRWRLYLEPFEPKFDALRPPDWVMRRHPSLSTRALSNGDVVTSVLAELESTAGHAESEAILARHCGVTRPAVRNALDHLLSTARIRVVPRGRSKAIELMA